MSQPLCPNCREGMSSAEVGLSGVWSCIYCEGVWLSRAEVLEMVERRGIQKPLDVHSIEPARLHEDAPPLRCPSCEKASFASMGLADSAVFLCSTCHSMFVPRAAV